MINIKNDLKNWLVDYIINTIHNLASDSTAFNSWAKSLDWGEVDFVVDMEFICDFGYDTREEIEENEAKEYADRLMKIILNKWYL